MPDKSTHIDSVIKDIHETVRTLMLENKEDGQGNNIILRTCPFCKDDKWKFYISVSTEMDTETNSPKAGWYNCFKCPTQGKSWLTLKQQLSQNPEVTITQPFKYKSEADLSGMANYVNTFHNNLFNQPEALSYLLNRGITNESISKFKLGYAEKQINGNKVGHIVIPHIFDYKLANIKFRTLPPAPKLFTRVTGAASVLFNYDNIDHDKDYIYICEGEMDAISLYQAGEKNIVSITCGARSFLPEWYDLLKKFDRVYIVMDNDVAGQDGAEYIARRLGTDKCFNILLPPDVKDMNEYFQHNTLDDFISLSITAKPFTIENVYALSDLLGKLERNMFSSGSVVEGHDMPWDVLTDRMGKIGGGDLIYLSAKPGAGKTTLALNVAYDFSVRRNLPTLFFCLEMRPERLAYKLMCRHRQTSDALISHDDICMTRADLGEAPIYFGYAANQKTIGKDKIFDVFREARKKYGIELLVFDNLHFLCRSITHLTQEISLVSRSFKLLAEELHIPIIVIAHPKKVDDDKLISSNHMKDSSAMHADADFVLLMHRNKMSEGDIRNSSEFEQSTLFEPMTLIVVDKARFAPGGVCKLYYEGDKSYFRIPTEGEILLHGGE